MAREVKAHEPEGFPGVPRIMILKGNIGEAQKLVLKEVELLTVFFSQDGQEPVAIKTIAAAWGIQAAGLKLKEKHQHKLEGHLRKTLGQEFRTFQAARQTIIFVEALSKIAPEIGFEHKTKEKLNELTSGLKTEAQKFPLPLSF